MQYCTGFGLFSLSLLLHGVVASLPYGCGGTLGILDVTAPYYNSLVWTCAGIVPVTGFQGALILVSTLSAADESSCGNQCATEWYLSPNLPDGLGATGALWFSDNSTCQCWFIGDDTGDLIPATETSDSATYIGFLNVFGAPPSAKDWGVFTCPEGSDSLVFMSDPSWAECYSLTVTPAGPPIAQGGPVGGECGQICGTNYGAQYAIIEDSINCYCYDDLAGLKYYFNLTSTYTVVDIYDFGTPTSTLTSKSSSTSTFKSSSTSKSSSKSTSSKPTSSKPTSSKSTSSKSTSSGSTSSKSSSKSSSTSTSKKSSISTSKLSSTTLKSTHTGRKSTSRSTPAPKSSSTSTPKLSSTTHKSTSTAPKSTSTSK